jgi:hypothetical protein
MMSDICFPIVETFRQALLNSSGNIYCMIFFTCISLKVKIMVPVETSNKQ